jgi:2-iminobutanoate/2-iminopropanoate deaminase
MGKPAPRIPFTIITVRPASDELLLGIAGVSATVIGLFLVGVLFFVEGGMRWSGRESRAELWRYMRSGTRIVMLLFAMALLLSLALVALELSWARALFVVLSALLVVANVETAVKVRATRVTQSRTLLLNEIAGTVGVAAIVALPWILGGLRPSREDLTLAAFLALATAFASVSAMALSTFDLARLESAPPSAEVRLLRPASGVYPATDDYAHGVEIRNPQRLVLVAGTMGLDPAGVAGASLEEQLTLVWDNLRAILAAAGMTLDNVVRVTSYLRDAAYAEENARARVAALGRAVPTTAIVTQTLADDWLIEIEVIAAG